MDSPHAFTVSVSDEYGSITAASFTVSVANNPQSSNTPTIISTPPTKPILAGETFRYDVRAEGNDDGNALVFALTNHPGSTTIDTNTGAIMWETTHDIVGVYHFTVTVTE